MFGTGGDWRLGNEFTWQRAPWRGIELPHADYFRLGAGGN